jgi:hypothetical protein
VKDHLFARDRPAELRLTAPAQTRPSSGTRRVQPPPSQRTARARSTLPAAKIRAPCYALAPPTAHRLHRKPQAGGLAYGPLAARHILIPADGRAEPLFCVPNAKPPGVIPRRSHFKAPLSVVRQDGTYSWDASARLIVNPLRRSKKRDWQRVNQHNLGLELRHRVCLMIMGAIAFGASHGDPNRDEPHR